jgi:predicted GNAT family acetyltransferase
MPEPAAVTVRHNPAEQRFEAPVDGHLAVASHRAEGAMLRMFHTEVPPALGGRGIAAALVQAAFVHAEANGLRIVPACSYVRSYMQKHPDTQKLLPEGMTL